MPASASRFLRVEYLDFQTLAEHREFRLRVYGLDGSTEFRFRIAIAAFGRSGVRLQDGPDVCYQKLLRAVTAGEMANPDTNTISDDDLASYRVAHTKVVKHRKAWVPPVPPSPETPDLTAMRQARPASPRVSVAPPVASDVEPALEKGQRVSHAVYGVGVTTSSDRGHTVICFDDDGSRTFVTSILKLDVLSAPNTWETSPRGSNRLRRTS